MPVNWTGPELNPLDKLLEFYGSDRRCIMDRLRFLSQRGMDQQWSACSSPAGWLMNLGLFIIPSQYLAPLFSSGWWWLEHLDYDFPIILGISSSQLKIQKSSALREYGYAKPIFSVDGRAQLVDGSRTSKAVWKYLHPGGYTVANFTRPWSPKQGWMCTNCEVSKQSRAHVTACKHSWTKLTKLTFTPWFFRGVGRKTTNQLLNVSLWSQQKSLISSPSTTVTRWPDVSWGGPAACWCLKCLRVDRHFEIQMKAGASPRRGARKVGLSMEGHGRSNSWFMKFYSNGMGHSMGPQQLDGGFIKSHWNPIKIPLKSH